jgi:heavy metal sensor kinase
MNTRSLKFRMVVWHASWLTVLFIVFGFFVYESLDFYLKRSLREALARRTRQVADLVQRTPLRGQALGEEIQNNFAPEANNRFTRATINGVVVYVSGQPFDRSFDPTTVPPAVASTTPETGVDTFFDHRPLPDGRAMFIEVLTRTMPDLRLVIEEGEADAPINATLHAWLAALIFGLALLIFGAVLGGYLLVQRSLTPVFQIIHSAERISSRNLSERLPVPDTHDELQQLSIALNHMIRRLDAAFQHNQQFLADASHELRTPLTTIQAEVETILSEPGCTPSVRELAVSTLEDVERLKVIVEGLFALSRLDAGEGLIQSSPFDLHALATSTAEQMCLLAEDKNITITCHPGPPVVIEADRSRVKQIIVNLLDNAVKYTPDGGAIDVRVTQQPQRAILNVSDNGMGIPRDALSHVFDRFYRVDKARTREQGGAGLGLSIVKSICTAHSGKVDVRSEEGRGTEFIVELPLKQGAA